MTNKETETLAGNNHDNVPKWGEMKRVLNLRNGSKFFQGFVVATLVQTVNSTLPFVVTVEERQVPGKQTCIRNEDILCSKYMD